MVESLSDRRTAPTIDWNDIRAVRRVVVINEAASKYFFGDANVLGQRISFGPGPYRPAEDYEYDRRAHECLYSRRSMSMANSDRLPSLLCDSILNVPPGELKLLPLK